MVLEVKTLESLADALATLEKSFDGMPAFNADVDVESVAKVLQDAAERMRDNYPYAHPLYAGQMLKPPHAVARLAYMLSLWVNPNNHALDGGRASSALEKDAVANIAGMYGWGDQHLGHLTSGGTMANLEALWIVGSLHPGKRILASSQAHYTHSRISDVLQIPFESVATDERGKMDVVALEAELEKGDVGTVVVTLGTTGIGSVDPLPEILALRDLQDFRVHVDAAYGGYYIIADNLATEARQAFDSIHSVDSIVVDPHKHGLQPYGCGCVLFRDPAVGKIYNHDSPYTYFSSDELHLGEISLECSRAGASAVALWATQKLLPMEPGSQFAQDLGHCRSAALGLYRRLQDDPDELSCFEPELDIVVWAPKGDSASEISALSSQVFAAAADAHLHLALVKLPAELLRPFWGNVKFDEPVVTCLRSCLMKPEHMEWLDEIWKILKAIRRTNQLN